MELSKAYDPKKVENKIYTLWEKSGYFNPDNLSLKKGAKPFCIIMPPPNANEALHLGHALTIGLEDILIRYNRMQGKKTLWWMIVEKIERLRFGTPAARTRKEEIVKK